MKILAAALAILSACAVRAAAQERAQIDDLSAPTSPAFVLLNVTPASVERPDNPRLFAVNLINALNTGRGLPQNYAVEVGPYWMASHPDLTFHAYQNPSTWQSILQSFLVSVGTAPIPGASAGADPLGTRIGLGLGTHIRNGRPSKSLEDAVAELEDINGRILDAIEKERRATTDAERRSAVDEEMKARKDARGQALAIQALDAERVGFFLAVAAGQTWGYLGDDISQAKAEKNGVWVTPSYRFRACDEASAACQASLDIIAVGRVLTERDKEARWDFGGRLVWKVKREFFLSVESLGRHDKNISKTVSDTGNIRTVAMAEYRVRSDLALYGSFGRDFKKDNGVNPLVSLLGLNLGFGSKPVLTADKQDASR